MAAAADIDEYLAGVPEPKRATLQAVRASIQRIVPDATECISYNLPAFRLDGKVVAGFAAFKNHLAYLPHSGGVFPQLASELEGYTYSDGSLRFAVDVPLPDALIEQLIAVRRAEAGV